MSTKFSEAILKLIEEDNISYVADFYMYKELGIINDNLDIVIDAKKFNIEAVEEIVRLLVRFNFFKVVQFSEFNVRIINGEADLESLSNYFTWLIKFFAYIEEKELVDENIMEVFLETYPVSEDCKAVFNSSFCQIPFDYSGWKFCTPIFQVKIL